MFEIVVSNGIPEDSMMMVAPDPELDELVCRYNLTLEEYLSLLTERSHAVIATNIKWENNHEAT